MTTNTALVAATTLFFVIQQTHAGTSNSISGMFLLQEDLGVFETFICWFPRRSALWGGDPWPAMSLS